MHMRECQFFLWVLITKFTISCLLFWVLRGPPPFYPLSLVFLPFFLYSLKLLISLKRMCMLLLWVLCVFINNNNIQFISINQTIIWSSRTTITSISTSTSTTVTASTTNTSISIQPTNSPTDQLTKQFKEHRWSEHSHRHRWLKNDNKNCWKYSLFNVSVYYSLIRKCMVNRVDRYMLWTK